MIVSRMLLLVDNFMLLFICLNWFRLRISMVGLVVFFVCVWIMVVFKWLIKSFWFGRLVRLLWIVLWSRCFLLVCFLVILSIVLM